MRLHRLPLALSLVILLGAFGGAALRQDRVAFDHEKHKKVFPECQTCHAGIREEGKSIFPSAESCANCHDGTIEKKVDWSAPPVRPSNFRFTHAKHDQKSGEKLPADSTLACRACHIPSGTGWLTVRRTISRQCLDCHEIKVAHFSAPDTACGTCHLTLAEATALPVERVADFEEARLTRRQGISSSKGHGRLAKDGNRSCAICHARDFCTQCHVNAPEVKAIQALEPDPRSLALKAELKAPASHEESRWLSQHGGKAKRDPAACAFCHTQESCVVCHRSRPAIVLALPEQWTRSGR